VEHAFQQAMDDSFPNLNDLQGNVP